MYKKLHFDNPDVALPWHQQLVMRIYLGHFVAGSSVAEDNRKVYEAFSNKIIALASGIPFTLHSIRVLVPVQAGLLNDTRYWSIAMTLEHLIMIDKMAKEIIIRLALGQVPDLNVPVKSVAPTGKIEPEKVFEDYRLSVPLRLDEMDEAFIDSKCEVTAPHPIFGDFNARQWQWSMAARSFLRHRQLQNIRKGLVFDPPAERLISPPLESQDV
ncbi:MAG: hypothetical protein HC883_01495 [Bdellovibrionaceae bacterium]|nr:hypothetical protein [Pseudobdellovibrionaceae bacterium]